MCPSVLIKYNKVIISDVDVVYLGDISESYFSFDEDDDVYLSGVRGVEKILNTLSIYSKEFSDEEINSLKMGVGGTMFLI